MDYLNKISRVIIITTIIATFFALSESHPINSRNDLHLQLKRLFAPTSEKTWSNWAGTVTNNPQYIFRPNTVDDLKDIVKNAKVNGKKVRCAAHGHSWSSLSATKDYLVIVNNLTKVTVQKNVKYGWTVTAEAGASVKQIDEVLRSNNPPLAIDSTTVIDSVFASGIVSTGSHGAKTQGATISDQVVALQIVTGDGLLGIIYTVTFRVEPLFNLRMIDTTPLATDWLKPANIKKYYESSDSLEVFYWPFNQGNIDTSKDLLWVKQWIRTQTQATVSHQAWVIQKQLADPIIATANEVYQFLLNNPELTPTSSATLWKLGPGKFPSDLVLEAEDALHFQPGLDAIIVDTSEFTFKVDKDFINVSDEILYILKRLAELAKQGQFPLNIIAEFRINKASKSILAPSYDNDPNAIYCNIELSSYIGTKGWQDFATEMGKRWIDKYQARPHWGKEWEYVTGVKSFLRTALGARLEAFEKVRAKYDLGKIFFDNDSLKQIFYG
ncbi:11812_t:CDS:2 [Ambispora gerdemannii]|uniref:D-arabinono-1,4-lactone oxidase n=1 Tax=Ambispora gerdemannii TaxID=144530 RepID=A0A9N9F7L5_9GLOM|nr:11812_t:CDS:2 [Ambispora gerdemannii]